MPCQVRKISNARRLGRGIFDEGFIKDPPEMSLGERLNHLILSERFGLGRGSLHGDRTRHGNGADHALDAIEGCELVTEKRVEAPVVPKTPETGGGRSGVRVSQS